MVKGHLRAVFYLWLTSFLLITLLGEVFLYGEESSDGSNKCSASDLIITREDIEIEQNIKGGYDLYVRKKRCINSILITESTADPKKKSPAYALRNPEFDPINGSEKRILNGKVLDPLEKKLYFLVDSTPEKHAALGEVFHIFIPYIVVFGYPWSRNGELQVLDGTFLNIRAFSKPYADYTGVFRDNPFVLRVVQKPLKEVPNGKYMDEAVDAFKKIASMGEGEAVKSVGKEDMVDKIGDILDDVEGDSIDLVLALDTTESMHDDMPALKQRIIPLLKEHINRFKHFRIGILLYKDYMEKYLYKPLPFSDNLAVIKRNIDSIRVSGGRDLPEAVYEALYASIHSYDWVAKNREIILIGDAPPHPRPRGKITKEMVFRDAKKLGIRINTIILPSN